MVEKWDCLTALFGFTYSFDFFATVDDSLATAATNEPINYPAAAPDINSSILASPDSTSDGLQGHVSSNAGGSPNEYGANIPSVLS